MKIWLGTFLSRFLPLLFWAVLIFAFSANSEPYQSLPADWSDPVDPTEPYGITRDEILGRFLHAGEYAVLAVLAARAVIWKGKIKTTLLGFCWAGAALYGLSDEFHQLFVPGRAFQLGDLALDGIGALLGVLIYAAVRGWARTRETNTR